jgi:hypothetical protein
MNKMNNIHIYCIRSSGGERELSTIHILLIKSDLLNKTKEHVMDIA